jgi:hypothetical protein
MTWFGESWGAPINKYCGKSPTPVGELCCQCDKPIKDGDRGVLIPYISLNAVYAGMSVSESPVPFHYDCFLDTLGLGKLHSIEEALSEDESNA